MLRHFYGTFLDVTFYLIWAQNVMTGHILLDSQPLHKKNKNYDSICNQVKQYTVLNNSGVTIKAKRMMGW